MCDIELVTSQGPATAMEFSLKIVEVLKGKSEAKKVADGLLVRVMLSSNIILYCYPVWFAVKFQGTF